uniref:MARVEL domain-containing protein n=1 Tax=Steinernema glaseri TaxID=37863 RepID=A0A1I7ZA29_9BILA
MTGVAFWNQKTTNPTAMYSIGLREVIISALILFSSTYGLYSACLDPGHRFGTAVIASVTLLSTLVYLFNADRILSITHNIRILLSTTNAYPISGVMLLILYCLLIVLAFALVVVTVVTFAVHFPATKPDCPAIHPSAVHVPMAADRSHPRTPHFGGSRL